MAKRFSLTEEKLDDLFVEEVASVVKLVGRLPAKDQIAPICTRWLHIFQQSTPKERFSRNYMLLLLHKQLNEQKTLTYPFTNPKTSQMDLPTIHQMSLKMDNKTEHQSGVGDECRSNESLDEEELSSFKFSRHVKIDYNNKYVNLFTKIRMFPIHVPLASALPIPVAPVMDRSFNTTMCPRV